VTWFEPALTALTHLPETRETLEQAVDLRFDLRNSLWTLGEFERVFGYLREAERFARSLADQQRLARVSVYMSQCFWATGQPREALEFGQSALAIAEALRDIPLQVAANYYLGVAYLASGEHRPAENSLQAVVRLLEGDLSRERLGLAGFPAVMARCFMTWVLAETGTFQEGITCGEEGVRLAESLDHPFSLILMCVGLGSLYSAKGKYTHAVRLLERGLAVARDGEIPLLLPHVLRPLGYVYILSGHVADGLSLLKEALGALESIGMGVFQALFVAQLGEAWLRAGSLGDALELAKRALTLARERGERGNEAWALRLLGEVAVHTDLPEVEKAEEYYHQTITLAADLSMRPLVSHCHLGLGKLYRRTGTRRDAQEHLGIATTMYREMDMTYWVEQAEANMMELK
jgi:tetratricopeptide (TPR) repeat protein